MDYCDKIQIQVTLKVKATERKIESNLKIQKTQVILIF